MSENPDYNYEDMEGLLDISLEHQYTVESVTAKVYSIYRSIYAKLDHPVTGNPQLSCQEKSETAATLTDIACYFLKS